ncbi:MAG: hypothetical protein JAY90_20280 [Candidatus Thiodiazotropha lotti]|nr:hypothetical protein [Candidatus Thiodiazotropha lotti]
MNFFDDLLDVAKDVAPTVAGMATTIATGGNPAAGAMVSSIFERILGKRPESPQEFEDMAAEILGNPESIQQFRIEMRQAELEELRIRTLDTQDARKTLGISIGAVLISVIVVLSYAIAIIYVMTEEIPAGSQNLTYLLLGNLGTGFGMVLTFWLGSSTGSKEKTQVLAQYADAAKADQEARRKAGGN